MADKAQSSSSSADAEANEAKPFVQDGEAASATKGAGRRRIKKMASRAASNSGESALVFERVLVLDPGFRSRTGHHYNNNMALTEAATALGCELKILAGDTLEGARTLEPFVTRHFGSDLYGGANHFQSSWEFDSWLSVNAEFARDLAAIPTDFLDWADLILVPAITQFHALALSRFLAATLQARPRQSAAIQLMFSPTWTAWDAICTSGPQMYEEALELLAPFVGKQVQYFSELPASCAEFEPLVKGRVSVLPHPGIWPKTNSLEGDRARQAGLETVRIGYFGYAKREKGFHLLPQILEDVRSQYGSREVSFTIQVNHGNYDAEIVEADTALNAAPASGLTLLKGALSDDVYLREFADSHLILLPYDPELYRGRGSGVFSEAIGFGKVLVAPRSSGVGAEIEAGKGAGVLFDDHTSADIARAVTEAINRFKVLHSSAVGLASEWRLDHSGRSFLRRISDELRRRA